VTVPSHSPDSPESFDLPDRDRTRGPLALILSSLRLPTQTALDQISAVVTAGLLNATQSEHVNAAINALHQVLNTVERYAPTETMTRLTPPPQPRAEESWSAGEQPDALDDRYQDGLHPFSDDPNRDSEV